MTSARDFTVGVCIRSIKAEPRWWLDSAVRLDRAGYDGIWSWDHVMGRDPITDPVVEAWTILAMAAARTERATIGPFVANVMNRHPSLLARMASTLQIASGGRLILGMGIGGGEAEHRALGIPWPDASERVRHLTEAVATIRALWSGGPVTRDSPLFPLRDAAAHPVPDPLPQILIGGETASGARLAGSIGDGWTAFEVNFEQHLPLYLASLEASGRRRADQLVLVGFQGEWLDDSRIDETEWIRDPAAARERWAAAGADGAVLLARTTQDVDQLVAAADRR